MTGAIFVLRLVGMSLVSGAIPHSIPVETQSLFKVQVKVAGAHAESDVMIFDTGSPYTWLYHYRYVRDILRYPQGGYSVTRLKTRIRPPEGGRFLKYVDDSEYDAGVWTIRRFKMGDHEWVQPFGIVVRASQADFGARATGLFGASRGSHFVQLFPVFGFVPVSSGLMSMVLNAVPAAQVCLHGQMVRFNLTKKGPFASHWASDTQIHYNRVLLNAGVVFDTGASVLGLNGMAFASFTKQLESLGIRFEYAPDFMHGRVDCADVRHLPNWEIRQGSQTLLITPQMYVSRRSLVTCQLHVGKLDGNHPIILGTPLLGHVVSEFNAQEGTVSLCRPLHSGITDYGHTVGAADFDEIQNCPRCGDRGSAVSYPSLVFMFLLLFI